MCKVMYIVKQEIRETKRNREIDDSLTFRSGRTRRKREEGGDAPSNFSLSLLTLSRNNNTIQFGPLKKCFGFFLFFFRGTQEHLLFKTAFC